MKFNRLLLFSLLVMLAVLLSACGTPPASNWPGMSTDGNMIYLASSSHVYFVQAQNGNETTFTNAAGEVSTLRFPLKASPSQMSFYAPPALVGDGAFVVGSAATSGHAFYAVNAKSANIEWTFENTKPWLGGALVLDGTVFAPSGDGTLYAFSPAGNMLWERNLSKRALWTTPVSDGKSLYVVTLDHMLYAIDPASGKDVWSPLELDNGIVGAPALADGILYFGTLSGNFYAINSANGSQVWVQKLEGSIWGTPGYSEGILYIGTVHGTAGKFYAIEAATGSTEWFKDEEGSIIAGPLVVDQQIIYVTEGGRIQSVDTSGAPKWQDHFEKNKIYTPPLLVNDLVVVAPMGSQFLMVAYDLNGAKKWTFTPAK